jgi:photosystem II stability/assembly factor-like uncharacterized protein
MPFSRSRRAVVLLALVGLAVLAAAAAAFLRPGGERDRAEACPPGYVSHEELEAMERRERAGLGADAAEAEREREAKGETAACRSRKHPESIRELLAIQGESGRRARGGQRGVRSGAYASAVRERARIAAERGTLPGSGGTWTPAGTGPLIADDERYGEVNQLGLAELNGRISDFAYDPQGKRLFAAVGEGGVWQSGDTGKTWRSIGDSLPTQAVGGIDWSPAGGGTLVIATGDSVFGGGGTFAGLGAFRSTDGGQTWQRSAGVPSGVIAFKVAADPTDPGVFYVATGAGLFRSADAGATFANVALPTSPDCAGASPDEDGCFLANMVTDVVVQGPANEATGAAATPGAVVAAVGWRAGDKVSQYGYVESPGNGLYASRTGAPGSFEKLDAPGFTDQTRIGRIELGEAAGPEQDHGYLYAIVEDSERFNGGAPVIDVPGEEQIGLPNNTTLDGIYVSGDFGETWTRMAEAEELKDPTAGSALAGTACGTLYCPGIQSWYNEFVSPDPTRQTAAGIPTRLVFGLEEVWQGADTSTAQNRPGPQTPPKPAISPFEVIGPYFSGGTCLFLNAPLPGCPTTAGDPAEANTTTHPDQHASIWIPHEDGGVTLVVGNDGGVYTQRVGSQASGSNPELSPDNWGRGSNQGFNTLLPYDAQVAKDGTIWAGLQDNGELKIEPDGRQFQTQGGDGTFSAVDPDASDVAYEGLPYGTINKTSDGGRGWDDHSPPADDGYQFITPFTMDPADPSHLVTAGQGVYETTDGAGDWTEVFNLGESSGSGAMNQMSAIDVRGVGDPLPVGKRTEDFTFAGSSPPVVPGGGSDAPGTYVDRPFTIAADEGNARATIEVSWGNGVDDWDLTVFRKEGGELVQAGRSAQGPPTTKETVVLSRPRPGDYVIRVQDYAATGSFSGKATFAPASPGDSVADGSAAYVAFCGYCDALNRRPFANGIATNVSPDGEIGRAGTEDGWRFAGAEGLPRRYVTSIQIDPSDDRTVYVTLGGYSRRWLPPGSLGPDEGADLGGGNVWKSTDAGETFRDVSGDLPDIPANWTLVRNGQLIVATNFGVFTAAGTDGGSYELLGSGLPTAPVFTLELKPKASAAERDTLIAATQGRGVYRYEFDEVAKPRPPATTAGGATQPGAAQAPPSPVACKASRALTSASARGTAGEALDLAFERSVSRPVLVDVFQQSIGRRVIGERLVARFRDAREAFTWDGKANLPGRRVRDGYFMVRFRLNEGNGLIDNRRIVLARDGGRWSGRPAHYGREGCTLLRSFKLERPVFGGSSGRSLGIAFRLARGARVTVTVTRGDTLVRRYGTATRQANRTHRLRLSARGLPRGDYRVRVRAVLGATERESRTLTSRRL